VRISFSLPTQPLISLHLQVPDGCLHIRLLQQLDPTDARHGGVSATVDRERVDGGGAAGGDSRFEEVFGGAGYQGALLMREEIVYA
jgi:hypothetical protein